jgi:hypothetical protein
VQAHQWRACACTHASTAWARSTSQQPNHQPRQAGSFPTTPAHANASSNRVFDQRGLWDSGFLMLLGACAVQTEKLAKIWPETPKVRPRTVLGGSSLGPFTAGDAGSTCIGVGDEPARRREGKGVRRGRGAYTQSSGLGSRRITIALCLIYSIRTDRTGLCARQASLLLVGVLGLNVRRHPTGNLCKHHVRTESNCRQNESRRLCKAAVG